MPKKAGSKDDPKGGGRKPLIAFRVESSAMELLAEIRMLEPLADPGLLPRQSISDSEMARWIFLEGADRTRNRLKAIIRVNRCKLEIESLRRRLKIRKERFDHEGITAQQFADEKFEIENKINSLENEIKSARIFGGLPDEDGIIYTGSNEFEEAFNYKDTGKSEISEDFFFIYTLLTDRATQRRLYRSGHREEPGLIPTPIKDRARETAKKYNGSLSSIENIKKLISSMMRRPELISEAFYKATIDSSDFPQKHEEFIKKHLDFIRNIADDDLIPE